tara:strand:+ start:1271 stop:1474 length:204 start_codon:yes stop_codon:yes gene_type:complete
MGKKRTISGDKHLMRFIVSMMPADSEMELTYDHDHLDQVVSRKIFNMERQLDMLKDTYNQIQNMGPQ